MAITKARLLRKHGGKLPNPEDHHTLQKMVGYKGGEKHNTRSVSRAAKKSARHMSSEARWQGGDKIVMASQSITQPASDYTRQVSPRDGAIYKASTGKTFLRRDVGK